MPSQKTARTAPMPNGQPASAFGRRRREDQHEAIKMSVDETLERIRCLSDFARWIGMPVPR